MKFGKTYMETIANPSFPKEWREGAIEYKHLKKLINGVVAELESLGLGADVLRELMEGAAPSEETQALEEDQQQDGHEGDESEMSSHGDLASNNTSDDDAYHSGIGKGKGKAGQVGKGQKRKASSMPANSASSGKSKLPLSPLMEDMEARRKSGEDILRNSTSLLSMTLPQAAMDMEVLDGGEAVDPLDTTSPTTSARTSSGSDPANSAEGLSQSNSTSISSVPPLPLLDVKPQVPRSSSITSISTASSSLAGDSSSPKPKIKSSGSSSSHSAAADWVSSLAEPPHHSATGNRRKSRGRSGQNTSESEDNQRSGRAGNASSRDSSVDERLVAGRQPFSRRRASDSAADPNFKSLSSSRESSVDRISDPDLSRGSESGFETGLGRKDLAAIRRRASEQEGGPVGMAPETHSPRSSEPSAGRHDWGGLAWRERNGPANEWRREDGLKSFEKNVAASNVQRSTTTAKGGWVQGKGGRRARAQYELGGTPEHPIPRIRLFIESPLTSDNEDEDSEGSGEDLDAPPTPFDTRKFRKRLDSEESTDDEDEGPSIVEVPDSPRSSAGDTIKEGGRRKHSGEEEVASLVGELRDLGIMVSPAKEEQDLSTSTTAIDSEEPEVSSKDSERPRTTSENSTSESVGHQARIRKREVVIPLSADTAFLDTLTNALANLSALQSAQREEFIANTNSLCASVAKVSSPYATKSDLYVWREIFTLWVEMQIFESEREKDRGELSVDESEVRLKRFAEELAKRGWTAEALGKATQVQEASTSTSKGRFSKLRKSIPSSSTVSTKSKLPMKDTNSLTTLENFLRLNMALLDVKKFQKVNVEAARKILKKHDKRTALTASNDLREFMAQQERARTAAAVAAAGVGLSGLVEVDVSGGEVGLSLVQQPGNAVAKSAGTHPSLASLLPSSATGLLSESLPHILLSLMTTTLLPILPSLDDYSCAICTGVAWRPIRLNCSHLFCIRCLVKLQKKGKSDCPLCRFKDAVASADGKNLDDAMGNFLEIWFPREVEEKDKENETERKKEELQELGIDHEKCTIC